MEKITHLQLLERMRTKNRAAAYLYNKEKLKEDVIKCLSVAVPCLNEDELEKEYELLSNVAESYKSEEASFGGHLIEELDMRILDILNFINN